MYYIITCIIIDIFNISEIYSHVTVLCIGQIEASTGPPPPRHTPGIWQLYHPGEEGIW